MVRACPLQWRGIALRQCGSEILLGTSHLLFGHSINGRQRHALAFLFFASNFAFGEGTKVGQQSRGLWGTGGI